MDSTNKFSFYDKSTEMRDISSQRKGNSNLLYSTYFFVDLIVYFKITFYSHELVFYYYQLPGTPAADELILDH